MGASFSGYAKALPVADVHPAHLAACLPRLSDASIRRLQACSRLSSSLGALLAAREGLAAWPEVESVVGPARLALASRAQIERAARVMGAIWHAAAVRSCISSGAVRWLVAEIGVEARMAAFAPCRTRRGWAGAAAAGRVGRGPFSDPRTLAWAFGFPRCQVACDKACC